MSEPEKPEIDKLIEEMTAKIFQVKDKDPLLGETLLLVLQFQLECLQRLRTERIF